MWLIVDQSGLISELADAGLSLTVAEKLLPACEFFFHSRRIFVCSFRVGAIFFPVNFFSFFFLSFSYHTTVCGCFIVIGDCMLSVS